MLAVTGYRSKIVEELIPLLPEGEEVARLSDYIPICDRYLLCAGIIRPKTLREQTAEEIRETIDVNCINPIRLCDAILEENPKARICVIGSESGFVGSFDGVYAAAKAGLHQYVQCKCLEPEQQLVCIAPSIIGDASMTTARTDIENLQMRMDRNPKKRLLASVEVSRMVHHLLYVDLGYTTNVVIRMNGGEHTL